MLEHTSLGALMLALGLAAGFIMHRADFCLVAPFRDAFLFRSTFMLKQLTLAVALGAMLFALVGSALPTAGVTTSPPIDPPVLGGLMGGLLFGLGMVLAGGCVVGTLYKMGSGSLTSLTAFAGLILGSGLYALMHTRLAPLASISLGTRADSLAELAALPQAPLQAGLGLAGLALCAHWLRRGDLTRTAYAKGYVQPAAAAVALASIGATAMAFTGMPLGITTLYAKLAAWGGSLLSPEVVSSLPYFDGQPFKLDTPLGVKLAGGAGPIMDSIAWLQGPTVAGIVGGAFLSAVFLGEFKPARGAPAYQFVFALAGGALMALGARLASGCNVWHLLGGLPALKLQSLVFFSALFPGAWLGGLALKASATRAAKGN